MRRGCGKARQRKELILIKLDVLISKWANLRPNWLPGLKVKVMSCQPNVNQNHKLISCAQYLYWFQRGGQF